MVKKENDKLKVVLMNDKNETSTVAELNVPKNYENWKSATISIDGEMLVLKKPKKKEDRIKALKAKIEKLQEKLKELSESN